MSVAGAVAAARREVERTLLTDTCAVRAVVDTSDGHGGYSQTWPTAITVSCMVASPTPAGGGQGGIIEAISEIPAKAILLPKTTVVRPAYRITPASSGVTYQVSRVEPPGTHEMALTCQCIEI